VNARITSVGAQAFVIPTAGPEADGTLSWDKTGLVTAQIFSGSQTGFGYSYSDGSAAILIKDKLAEILVGRDAFDIQGLNRRLWQSVRNIGRAGISACAISALDLALWDLKARLLGISLGALLGRQRDNVEIYGSGGFTNYDDGLLARQLAGWVEQADCRAVKMKIGSEPARDVSRVLAARAAIGPDVKLFVDANGAFSPRDALTMMRKFSEYRISWFEEPVSSDDLPGLVMVREHTGAEIDIAAGEYCFTLDDVLIMLAANAVDVQQCDITRCGGITGFMQAATLCEAFHKPLSAHCAPSAHLHAACAVPRLRHVEWFHDHVRIEQLLFDGAPSAMNGRIAPDDSRPGNGLNLKTQDAARYAV
jgi:L-alanine-DL-glutamate epimerase-like enolase superfamily enzyme